MGRQKVTDTDIRKALEKYKGVRVAAAAMLGVSASTMTRRLANMTAVLPTPHRLGYENLRRIRSTEGESCAEMLPEGFLRTLEAVSARWDPQSLINVIASHVTRWHAERVNEQRQRRVYGQTGAWTQQRLQEEEARLVELGAEVEDFDPLWPD